MQGLTISSCAFVQPNDVDLGRVDANSLSDALDVCVGRATLALQGPVGTYSDFQRDNIGIKFRCMQTTFRHIRVILRAGYEDPCSVDALAIARLALEDLYTLCLMLENSDYVTKYLQDGWRKAYIQFLLQAQETQNLARFDEYNRGAPPMLDGLRRMIGISDAQMHGVRKEQLGVAMPGGLNYEAIPRFPTPKGVIELLPVGDKRTMLERLYMEYVYLCSFNHGLSEAMAFKTMFDQRSLFSQYVPAAKRSDAWQRSVAERSFTTALLSVAQATAELTALYPEDSDLRGAAMNAWNVMADGHLLGQAIWNIRTRRLLGILNS